MKYKYFLLVFAYWIILEYALGGFYHFFSIYRFCNLIENSIFIGFVLFIFTNYKNYKLKIVFLKIIILLLVFMLWIETIVYLNFKIHFGPSSFFVLFNTNPDELREGFYEFFDIKLAITSILFFLPLIKLNRIAKAVSFFSSKIKKVKPLALITIVLIFAIVLKYSKLIDHNLPYVIARSVVINYHDQKQINKLNAEIDQKPTDFKNENQNTTNTFLVVIGESTTSAHMQLYGYDRETTPFLVKYENDLSVYTDVISSNTSTYGSLSKALTLGNYENPEMILALPITTLFNRSGFKTFWISNHSPTFSPASALARISEDAQKKFFNTKEVINNVKKYDGELLQKVDDALSDKSPNKIIFLHLIGAHFSYSNRYPETFDYFKSKPETKFKDLMVYDKINEYDNAIRYSDFILNELNKKIKNQRDNAYLMFFSDHGEEVFQDENFYGHLEDRPTKNTYKIPFLMWYSDSFNFPKDYFFDGNRKYMIDDLWHSIAHISGLDNTFVDRTRSIFSESFKNRARVILEDQDFETYFDE